MLLQPYLFMVRHRLMVPCRCGVAGGEAGGAAVGEAQLEGAQVAISGTAHLAVVVAAQKQQYSSRQRQQDSHSRTATVAEQHPTLTLGPH